MYNLRIPVQTLVLRQRCNNWRNCYKYLIDRGYAYKDGKSVEPKQSMGFRKYWMSRYMNYIKNYQTTLEKNFPKPMHVYRVFSIGSKDFFLDLKKYLSVRKLHRKGGLKCLTHEELQLWHTFPSDLIQISPLFLVSAIPFTNYIIFPMAYLFPRLLLTSHFWSLEQRFNFMLSNHKKRLKHNKPLLRCLQSKLDTIQNSSLKIKWSGIVACLGSGTHPTPSEIISCIQLFSSPPYSLDSLTRKHTKELLAIHGMSKWIPRRRQRLRERSILIQAMDNSIKREGGPSKLPNEAIRWALSFRGVNPANMPRESMQDWLNNWLQISAQVDENSISLLLHSPILLAYNYPTNWTLLYH
ncbi:LETM1 domain-containing protein 1 [Venturia canescens]|uniref:LETM1 domain-containing protein 1 n=1 Tax=Venturia canescens TaxID=32260 RepID=UPI001C9C3279|nr:LETM1 domain-containing protein 1 [Venturia canescens]